MSVISSGHLLFKIALSEGTERIEKFMTEHTITDEYAQHLVQITYTHTINPDHYLICIDLLQRQKWTDLNINLKKLQRRVLANICTSHHFTEQYWD